MEGCTYVKNKSVSLKPNYRLLQQIYHIIKTIIIIIIITIIGRDGQQDVDS